MVCVGKILSTLPGLEPGIFCSVGRRVIHCATRPLHNLDLSCKRQTSRTQAYVSISLYACKNEGKNWGFRRFQQLRSYRNEIETRNREEIPYSSLIVPRGNSVADGPYTALHNDEHLYGDQAHPLGDPAETRTCELTLGRPGIVTTRPRRIPCIMYVCMYVCMYV